MVHIFTVVLKRVKAPSLSMTFYSRLSCSSLLGLSLFTPSHHHIHIWRLVLKFPPPPQMTQSYAVLKHPVALSAWDEFAIRKQKYGTRVPPTWRHTWGGGCHNFTPYSKSGVDFVREMLSVFANFYYMLDVQLFLQPQFVHRREHCRRVTLSSVLSRTSQKTCIPGIMWLTLTKGTLYKEIRYFIIPLVRKSVFFFSQNPTFQRIYFIVVYVFHPFKCVTEQRDGGFPTVICAGMFSSARYRSPVGKRC